jgi:hypothetical protein
MTTDHKIHHGTLTTQPTTNPPDTPGCLQQRTDHALMLTSPGAPGWTAPNNLAQSLKTVETGPAGLAGSIPVRLR